jgi:DNA-binding response OmpR family regulator
MPSNNPKSSILVVDDDSTIVSFLEMALSFEGFNCLTATSGEEAVKLVQHFKPSLILLDISMPRMDGRDFCQWLHTNGHCGIPVVVMTAGQNAARTQEEVGAQDCLAKPFDLSELRSCVERWTRNT